MRHTAGSCVPHFRYAYGPKKTELRLATLKKLSRRPLAPPLASGPRLRSPDRREYARSEASPALAQRLGQRRLGFLGLLALVVLVLVALIDALVRPRRGTRHWAALCCGTRRGQRRRGERHGRARVLVVPALRHGRARAPVRLRSRVCGGGTVESVVVVATAYFSTWLAALPPVENSISYEPA